MAQTLIPELHTSAWECERALRPRKTRLCGENAVNAQTEEKSTISEPRLAIFLQYRVNIRYSLEKQR